MSIFKCLIIIGLLWASYTCLLINMHIFLLGIYLEVELLSPHGGKEPTCQCRRQKRQGFDPLVRKIPWRREWQPTPVFLPGESHGQRSLVGYSPWGWKESDSTERLRTGQHSLPGFIPLSFSLKGGISPSHCLMNDHPLFRQIV